jgi:hypothetical protein
VTGVEFNVDYTAVSAVLSLGTGWLLINTGRAVGQARLMVVAVRAWRADRRRSRGAAAVDGYQIGPTTRREPGRPLASYVQAPDNRDARSRVTLPASPTGGAIRDPAAARSVRAA